MLKDSAIQSFSCIIDITMQEQIDEITQHSVDDDLQWLENMASSMPFIWHTKMIRIWTTILKDDNNDVISMKT